MLEPIAYPVASGI
jgi:hypothetical protein